MRGSKSEKVRFCFDRLGLKSRGKKKKNSLRGRPRKKVGREMDTWASRMKTPKKDYGRRGGTYVDKSRETDRIPRSKGGEDFGFEGGVWGYKVKRGRRT